MGGLEPSGSPWREKKTKPNVFIATPEKKYAPWAFSFSKKKETLTLDQRNASENPRELSSVFSDFQFGMNFSFVNRLFYEHSKSGIDETTQSNMI